MPAATGPDSSDSSQWVGVGLGQSSAAPLYQAGTDSRANVTPQVFIEVYPQEAEVIKFNVSPGDVLGVHVVVTSTGATFHVVDKTASIDRTYTWSGVSKVDGHAEWIDERPTAPTGNLYAYAKNTTTFTSAQAYSTSTGWTNVGNAPHYYYNMFSCNGATQLASTGAISGTNSYAVNWKAYGIIEKC